MEYNRWYIIKYVIGYDLDGRLCTPIKERTAISWWCYLPEMDLIQIMYTSEVRPATDDEIENLYYALNMDGLADE